MDIVEKTKHIGKYKIELSVYMRQAFVRIEFGENGEFWSTPLNKYEYALDLYKQLKKVKDVNILIDQIEEEH